MDNDPFLGPGALKPFSVPDPRREQRVAYMTALYCATFEIDELKMMQKTL